MHKRSCWSGAAAAGSTSRGELQVSGSESYGLGLTFKVYRVYRVYRVMRCTGFVRRGTGSEKIIVACRAFVVGFMV